jgi:hypothetical protein
MDTTIEEGDYVKIRGLGEDEGVVVSKELKPLGYHVYTVKCASGKYRTVDRICLIKIETPSVILPPSVLESLLQEDMVEPSPIQPRQQADLPNDPNSSKSNIPNQPDTPQPHHADSQEEITAYIEEQQNSNTTAKTKRDITKFQSFLQSEGVFTTAEATSPEILARKVSKYLIRLRKMDGTNLETTSVTSIWGSICRHLRQRNYPHDPKTSPMFEQARQTLKSKKKLLKQDGKGNLSRAARPLEDDEVEKLYSSGKLNLKCIIFCKTKKKKKSLFRVTWPKIIGSVGRLFFCLFVFPPQMSLCCFFLPDN